MINPQLISLLALGPIMLGPLANVSVTQAEDGAISVLLCGGGSLIIPLADDSDDTPELPSHTMTGACHGVMRFGELDGDEDGEGGGEDAF